MITAAIAATVLLAIAALTCPNRIAVIVVIIIIVVIVVQLIIIYTLQEQPPKGKQVKGVRHCREAMAHSYGLVTTCW
jgi:hypothetical protein